MGKRNVETLGEGSATCKECGLTARNRFELDDHISHAHGGNLAANSVSRNSSAEQNPVKRC